MPEVRRGRYRGPDNRFYYVFGQGFHEESAQRLVILYQEDRKLDDREYDLVEVSAFLAAGYEYVGGRSIASPL